MVTKIIIRYITNKPSLYLRIYLYFSLYIPSKIFSLSLYRPISNNFFEGNLRRHPINRRNGSVITNVHISTQKFQIMFQRKLPLSQPPVKSKNRAQQNKVRKSDTQNNKNRVSLEYARLVLKKVLKIRLLSPTSFEHILMQRHFLEPAIQLLYVFSSFYILVCFFCMVCCLLIFIYAHYFSDSFIFFI